MSYSSINGIEEGKAGSKVHEYFDRVFLVNLKRERVKRLAAYQSLKKIGIDAVLWEAVDGYSEDNLDEFESYKNRELGKLHFAEYNELEVSRGKGFIESPGAWGYCKTYSGIIKNAIDQGLSRILIIEDDVIPHNNFEAQFLKFMDSVDSDWKLLQFGASQYNWESVDPESALEQGYYHPHIIHTCGSFAIGIDLSIGPEILDLVKPMESPFDLLPLGKIYERYPEKTFVAFPNLVMPDVATSTIRGGRSQKSHSERMKWEMSNFQYPRKNPSLSILFEDPELVTRVDAEYFNNLSGVDVNWILWAEDSWHFIHHHASPSLELGKSELPLEALDVAPLLDTLTSDYVITIDNSALDRNLTLDGLIEPVVLQREIPHGVELLKSFDYPVENDLVSIILPTYKRPDNLLASIKSLQDQTYKNIEIIVVDDNDPASDEAAETKEKVDELGRSDSRIKFIQHPRNLNGSAARNTGILASKGSHISFLDDDDIYFPEKIESCLNKLKELGDSFGGVYGGYLGWNSSESNLSRYVAGDLTEALFKLDYKSHYIHTNTTLFRREAVIRIGGFDDSFRRHQDLEFMIRYFQAYKIEVVPEPVARLKPSPTPTNNQQFGERLFQTKAKFLRKFGQIISEMPELEQNDIYRSHWAEVRKYCESDQQFIDLASGEDGIGLVQYFIESSQDPEALEEYKKMKSKIPTLSARIEEQEKGLQKVSELKKRIVELEQQKEWYESTYESLPAFWKYVGAAIRKIKKLFS